MRTSSLIYAGLGVIVLGGVVWAWGPRLASNMEKLPGTIEIERASLETFMAACVEPVLAGKNDVGEACRSTQAIKDTYDLDIKAHIDARHNLMKKTARRIAAGELSKPQDYKQCIADEKCAEVPLLSANVDPEKMTKEQRRKSEIFWDLAEKDEMTRLVCETMDECRAMTKLKVLDYGF